MEVSTQLMLASRQRTEDFENLYKVAFPRVATFVANRSGSFDDARDIFHDAMVILHEKKLSGDFTFDVNEEAYLIGVAKHLWLKKFKDDQKLVELSDWEKTISIPEDYFEEGENRLISVLELTGRKCMELLRAFYYENMPLQKIKSVFHFSNVHSASVQKFKCIEKVRETVQKKSLHYDDFR